MADRGINGGLNGLISFRESTIPGGPAIAFNVVINSYTGNLATRVIVRTGPGSGGVPNIRLADIRGGGSASGDCSWNGPPIPAGLQYNSGTLTYQLDTGYNIAFPVKVSDFEMSHVEKGKGQDELYHCDFKWTLAGAVTVTWPGNAVTFTEPTANDSPTYEGRGKNYDPRGIKSTATTRIDCTGIADDDVTQTSKIVSLIAAASAPMANLKPTSISCSQYEDDSRGLQVVVNFALQDSKDEIETPENILSTDPNDLKTDRRLASVYTTGSPPSTPSAPSGTKLIDTADKKVNDQLSARIWHWGKVDSKDEQELPRTKLELDSSSIGSEGTVAALDGTPSLPGGYVLVSTTTEHPTTDHTVTTIKYALRNSQQAIEYDGSQQVIDPNALKTMVLDTHVYVTGGGPPSPSVPSGLKLVESTFKTINTLKSQVTFRFGETDSVDDVQFAKSALESDPQGLNDSQSIAIVFTNSSPPSDPTPPNGIDGNASNSSGNGMRI